MKNRILSLLLLLCMINAVWATEFNVDFVVAADGSGDYSTV